MARKAATQVDSKFIKGLITESTALNFPEDACTETWNCVFDDTGRVTRRKGFDYEASGASASDQFIQDSWALTEYVWTLSQGTSLKTFVIVQIGNTLTFYDCSDTTDVGQNAAHTIDLLNYPLDVAFYDPSDYPCQYATGNNQLLIVNKGVNPLVVSYNDDTDALTVEEVTIQFRDFEGIEDGLTLTERPTSTVADLITNNPEHYYNLLNQGWHVTDALTQWDTARSDLPSNSDQVLFFRASETDAFDPSRVTAYSSVLNTPAPKGHFILEVGNISRTNALSDEGFSGTISSEAALIAAGDGSVVHNAFALGANAFDGDTTEPWASTTWGLAPTFTGSATSSFYVGKDFSAGAARSVSYVKLYASSDAGYAGNFDTSGGGLWPPTTTIHMELRGSNSAPVTGLEGTLLGSNTTITNYVDSFLPITIPSSDNATQYDYIWVAFYAIRTAASASTVNIHLSEVEIYEGTSDVLSYHRPQTVAFHAGRAWYAGIEDGSLNNSIYFSRIILNNEDYGKCYQANDPTSEFLSEVLPDDGGVIRILEAGRVLKLFSYQNSVLVFATNGVWRISFSDTTDFSVRKLASVNIDSPESLVDVKGIPVWWAEDGIYTVQYEANFDAFSVVSLTESKIKSFLQDIPRRNHKYVKGAYDVQEEIIYWIFNDDANLSNADRYTYNKVLCLNTQTQAFYPWEIADDSTPRLRGLFYLRDAEREEEATFKFISTDLVDNNVYVLAFGSFDADTYLDWDTQGDSLDYESYFITGYKIHGDAQRFGQINYIFIFLDSLTDSSCYLRTLFDFSNSGNSGKWSSSQQIYNPNITFRDVHHRRLKIRGRGRAIQFKFSSDTGKPFSIIGWSILESQNANV